MGNHWDTVLGQELRYFRLLDTALLRCCVQALETIYEATSDDLHVTGITELSCRQLLSLIRGTAFSWFLTRGPAILKMGIMLNLSWTNSFVSQNACSIASYMLLWTFIKFPAEFNETVAATHLLHFAMDRQPPCTRPHHPATCSSGMQHHVAKHCTRFSLQYY